jgi:hypothetical protein
MNPSCNVIEVKSSKVKNLDMPFTEEELELKKIRDFVHKLHHQTSQETLTKEIRKIQDASRITNISEEELTDLLHMLRKRKFIYEIITGELFG